MFYIYLLSTIIVLILLVSFAITFNLKKQLKRTIKEAQEKETKTTKSVGTTQEKIKELEKKLEEREKKIQEQIGILEKEEKSKAPAIINNLIDGLMILDNQGKVTQANTKLEEIFLIKKQDIEGKNLKDLKANPLFGSVVDPLFDEKGIKQVQSIQLSPREKTFIELSSFPLAANGFLLVFRDISKQKLSDELKTEFIMLAAHQLRTPLAGIKWNLKMLIDGDFGQLTPEQKSFLTSNYQNTERMIKLVNDLLDSTKIDDGRYLFYIKEEDIVKITESAIALVKDKAKQKNIAIQFEEPKEKIPLLNIDKEKIGVCVQNLLSNAIIYNKPAGQVTISINYDKNKKEVLVSVKDTGIGIAKEHQPRIFTKFYRSTPAMKVETVGSGLGLYMTKNIIEAHKGRAWFDSEEGKGSTFYLALPAADKKEKKNKKEKKAK